MLRRHLRLAVGLAVVVLLVAGALYRLSPMWPGPPLPPGATPLALATEPAHLMPTMGCPTALLLPARVAVADNALVLVPEAGGDPIKVVWPAGWVAWRLAGRAELVSRDGTVIGREGDIVHGFGGAWGQTTHSTCAWPAGECDSRTASKRHVSRTRATVAQ